MGKDSKLLFDVPVGIPFWGLEEHEPLIVDFFSLPYLTVIEEYGNQGK